MKIIKTSYQILTNVNWPDVLRQIEKISRTCYKSESAITPETSIKFVKNLIERGHESVLEHQSISVRVICDRGVSHEIVRHRIASYSQESTRFCNYAKHDELVFIQPCFWNENQTEYIAWFNACQASEKLYLHLINQLECTPQEARSILPNSLKTEIVMTMNLRECRYFFKSRAVGSSGKPHPQMLELTLPMLQEFKKLIHVVFNDLVVL
jgi:thymidylate synthase (FAD)